MIDYIQQSRPLIIGVIGASSCSADIDKLAEQVGNEIAKRNAILICGGLSGVMEAAARGAKSYGGLTIGILPGFEAQDANPYIDIPIVTGMSHARNLIIVRTARAIIAISGGYGTLSELAFAFNLEVPVVGLFTWDIDAPIIKVTTAKQAVDKAIQLATNKHS